MTARIDVIMLLYDNRVSRGHQSRRRTKPLLPSLGSHDGDGDVDRVDRVHTGETPKFVYDC